MKKLKTMITAAIAGVMALSIAGCGLVEKTPEAKQNTVLAKVEDTKITKADLDKYMVSVAGYLEQNYGEDYMSNEEAKKTYLAYAESYLDTLVAEKVLLKKGEDLGFKATDEEVKSKLEEIKASYETEESYQEALKGSGLDDTSVLDYLREQIIMNAVIEDSFKGLEATEGEIKAYYDEHIADYTKGPGAKMYHILVADEATAKEIKEKLNNGEDFGKLASEYGTDGTKQTGGELGYYPYENSGLDSEFIAAAQKLGENEISDPVKTQFGWHIIKTTDLVKDTTVTPLEKVTDEIKEAVLSEKQNATYSENLEKWKEEYKVKTYPEKIEELIG